MDLKVISSGSKGNIISVKSGHSTMLVDLGLPKTKAEKTLLDNGIAMKDVCGVLLTHAHSDHVKSTSLAEKYNIPVFASEGTFKTVEVANSEVVEHGLAYSIGCFSFVPFNTFHDDYQSYGYVISDGEQQVSVLLDTGKVTGEMLLYMCGSTHIVIEANYADEMLEANDKYPDSVRARIASDLGHLSNLQAAEALCKLVEGKGEHIYLCHLSSANNIPALARVTVENALWFNKGFKAGKHYFLEVM